MAPAPSASMMRRLSENEVSTTTCASGLSATMRLVASMPSSTGMERSMSTTSGRSRAATATASSPSDTIATTSMSGAVDRSCSSPPRTIA